MKKKEENTLLALPAPLLELPGSQEVPLRKRVLSALARGLKELVFMLLLLALGFYGTIFFLFRAEESTVAVGGFAREKEILAIDRAPDGVTLEVFGKRYALFKK